MPSDADDRSDGPPRSTAAESAGRGGSDGPPADRERTVLLAVALVGAATLLYSVLVVQQILAWFGIAIPLAVLYLLWRFVRAHERVAAALEARNR